LSFYPADLARIHDEGYGDFARAAACEFMRRVPAPGLVVELGCGTGISSALLAAAGYEVLGIDISPDMLAIARHRLPHAEFRQGSLWDAELPPCTGVTAIGEVINYAADERAGAERLPQLCARIYEALQPGGLFMFDFATPGRATDQIHVRSGDDWEIESATAESGGVLERRMTIATGSDSREEVHRLRLYGPEFVLKCLADAGLSSEALDRYCGFGFWPGYAAFAAVKRVQLQTRKSAG
jgi:SAM-dependent methyltransferase